MVVNIQKKRTTIYLGGIEIGYLKKVGLGQGKSASEYIRELIRKDMGRSNKYSLQDLKSLTFTKDKHPGKVDEIIY